MFKKKRIYLLTITMLFSAKIIFAYDSEIIHPKINETASKKSQSLYNTLNKLDFADGVNEKLNGKEIYKWFREGGTEEDKAPRWVNHFHDPTECFRVV